MHGVQKKVWNYNEVDFCSLDWLFLIFEVWNKFSNIGPLVQATHVDKLDCCFTPEMNCSKKWSTLTLIVLLWNIYQITNRSFQNKIQLLYWPSCFVEIPNWLSVSQNRTFPNPGGSSTNFICIDSSHIIQTHQYMKVVFQVHGELALTLMLWFQQLEPQTLIFTFIWHLSKFLSLILLWLSLSVTPLPNSFNLFPVCLQFLWHRFHLHLRLLSFLSVKKIPPLLSTKSTATILIFRPELKFKMQSYRLHLNLYWQWNHCCKYVQNISFTFLFNYNKTHNSITAKSRPRITYCMNGQKF